MTVLGRGLVFQPVLVTQSCTYDSKNITLTLRIFHQKRKKIFLKKNNPPPQGEQDTTELTTESKEWNFTTRKLQ